MNLDELNVRQRKVVHATEKKIFVFSRAACGKTKTLIARIQYLIEEKKVPPEEIYAISFTNLAAEEIKSRLGDCAKNVFSGTLHSLANRICKINGIPTNFFIQTEEFDRIISKAMTLPSQTVPHIGYLIIDEAQDLTPLDYKFTEFLNADNMMFFGDDHQLIYDFRGASFSCVENYLKDVEWTKYYLIENYRNSQKVAEMAESFISNMPQNISHSQTLMKTSEGEAEVVNFSDALEELETVKDWGSWFILARTNKEVEQIQEILDIDEVPNATFKQGDVDLKQLKGILQTNKVLVLTGHAVKGLQRKKVIAVGFNPYNDSERRVAYVAASRAEEELYWCVSLGSSYEAAQGRKALKEKEAEGEFVF